MSFAMWLSLPLSLLHPTPPPQSLSRLHSCLCLGVSAHISSSAHPVCTCAICSYIQDNSVPIQLTQCVNVRYVPELSNIPLQFRPRQCINGPWVPVFRTIPFQSSATHCINGLFLTYKDGAFGLQSGSGEVHCFSSEDGLCSAIPSGQRQVCDS